MAHFWHITIEDGDDQEERPVPVSSTPKSSVKGGPIRRALSTPRPMQKSGRQWSSARWTPAPPSVATKRNRPPSPRPWRCTPSKVTSKKRSSDSELLRIQALQRHPLAHRSLASIRGADIISYRDRAPRRRPGCSHARRELALISHVFTIARKEWRLESLSNPIELIRQPSVDDARDRRILRADVLTLRDDEMICEHLDELKMICRHACSAELPQIVLFAIEAGMRRSEIAGLLRSNVVIEKRTATLLLTKNGSSRGVPLSSRVAEIVNNQPKCEEGRVFKSRPDTLSKAFSDADSRCSTSLYKRPDPASST